MSRSASWMFALIVTIVSLLILSINVDDKEDDKEIDLFDYQTVYYYFSLKEFIESDFGERYKKELEEAMRDDNAIQKKELKKLQDIIYEYKEKEKPDQEKIEDIKKSFKL